MTFKIDTLIYNNEKLISLKGTVNCRNTAEIRVYRINRTNGLLGGKVAKLCQSRNFKSKFIKKWIRSSSPCYRVLSCISGV